MGNVRRRPSQRPFHDPTKANHIHGFQCFRLVLVLSEEKSIRSNLRLEIFYLVSCSAGGMITASSNSVKLKHLSKLSLNATLNPL